MKLPNWQHNSGKEPKRTLKPQALRSARERRRQLKKRLLNTSSPRKGFYNGYIQEEKNEQNSQSRDQRSTSKVTCY